MRRAARTLPHDFVDPFGTTADPARYVPRAATERALEDLERAVVDQRASVLLCGTPGIGKTLVLRLLRRRLEPELQVIHLPYASLPPAALCGWALSAIDAPSSYDPIGALATQAHAAFVQGGGIVLLIDDADAMPEETARALGGLTEQSHGGLRFVAASDRDAAERLGALLGPVVWVSLVDAMTPAETLQYVQTHLHAAHLPAEVIGAFDADTIASLHRRTGGVPGRVGAEATAVVLEALRRHVPAAEPERAPEREAAAAPELEPASDTTLGRIPLATGVSPPPSLEAAPASRAAPPEAPAEPTRASAPEAPRAAEPAPGKPPPEAGGPPPAGSAEAPQAALERAAGRLALAHSGADPAQSSPALERAAGRLALARQRDAAAAAKARRVKPPRRLGRTGRLGLAVFAACFVIGAGIGLVLMRREASAPSAPAPVPAPQPAVEVPAAPPEPEVRPVRVQINATPWATIQVDGEEVGVTPLAGVLLKPGTHHFEARFPDGRVVEREVEIDQVNRFVAFR